jgi:curved DNA-binding protein CbpA
MQNEPVDHYETLQISPNAEPETIHRVYRLLAQRYHPDNKDTGNADRFRVICDAYAALSDPQQRAQYDVAYQQQRQNRWRLVHEGADAENEFEMQRVIRLTILEVLYTQRRVDARDPGLLPLDLEEMIGAPREHVEFTIWFLVQNKLVHKSDSSKITITVDGVEYLEHNYQNQQHRRRLRGSTAGTH